LLLAAVVALVAVGRNLVAPETVVLVVAEIVVDLSA
jgi:hypothetical protein